MGVLRSVMRAIDTNVLVRIAARDHEKQTRAAEEYVAKGAWVSHVVLAECAWVLTALYGLSRSELADTLRNLLNHASIVVQDADVVSEAVAQFAQRKALSFPDCLILEIARKAGHTPLATFDRDWAKLEGVEKLGKN